MRIVLCHYCKRPASLVSGRVIYPSRPDLFGKEFWNCAPCRAYVGTHAGSGGVPLGRLANAELRAWKKRAHAAFDPLWKSGEMARGQAYALMRRLMNMTADEAHIGEFDVAECQRLIAALAEYREVV